MTGPAPARYRVGCAGMFEIGTDYGMNDLDEAIAACQHPPGCEILDTRTGKWIGPHCQQDIDDAKARLAARTDP